MYNLISCSSGLLTKKSSLHHGISLYVLFDSKIPHRNAQLPFSISVSSSNVVDLCSLIFTQTLQSPLPNSTSLQSFAKADVQITEKIHKSNNQRLIFFIDIIIIDK
jgi:hypothetical protein